MADDGPGSLMYPWRSPVPLESSGDGRGLMLLNSLTMKKEMFMPADPGAPNTVRWYICGPTVYDSAHLGHARTYLALDVVRRVMEDYFGYDMVVQMNITDIDDKIIKRANETEVDHSVIARKFEAEFIEDLELLGCRTPTFTTRVTDYVQEIVDYISKIIENGSAYESNGSVYFDVDSFIAASHNYAKLEPTAVGNGDLLADGEGALAAGDTDKRSPKDFALWKKSKPGEPEWKSPWSNGRPGWHIECSVMASKVLGNTLDIHAGGVDLKFPHHDNEIAQAEAYFECDQWINYFIHSGHLSIDGLKMSKSLKNFITIRAVLERYNAQQLRILFLHHKYEGPMVYSEGAMVEAVNVERTFVDFFGNVKAVLRRCKQSPNPTWKPSPLDHDLLESLKRSKMEIHASFQDNINTADVMKTLKLLIKEANLYLRETCDHENPFTIRAVGVYVTYILKVMGLGSSSDIGLGGSSDEGAVDPVLNALSVFRDSVKDISRNQNDPGALKQELLGLCDQLRDDILPPLGVRLEDRGDSGAVWKIENPDTVMREVARRRATEHERLANQAQRVAELAAKQQELLEKGRISPEHMFREGDYAGLFRTFDDQGLPLTDSEGVQVTSSRRKKLVKEQAKQTKLHTKFLAAQTE